MSSSRLLASPIPDAESWSHMESRRHRSAIDFQHLGDCVVAQIGVMTEKHRHSLSLRKQCDRGTEGGPIARFFVDRSSFRGLRVRERGARPANIDACTGECAPKPRLEPRLISDLPSASYRASERLLRHIPSWLAIADDADHDAEEPYLVATVDDGRCDSGPSLSGRSRCTTASPSRRPIRDLHRSARADAHRRPVCHK